MAFTDLDKPLEDIIKQKKSKLQKGRAGMSSSLRKEGQASGGNRQRSDRNKTNRNSNSNNNRASVQKNRHRESTSDRRGNAIHDRLGKVNKNARSYQGVSKPERISLKTLRGARAAGKKSESGLVMSNDRPVANTSVLKAEKIKIDPTQLVITASIRPSRSATATSEPSMHSPRAQDIIINSKLPRSHHVQKRRGPVDEKPVREDDVNDTDRGGTTSNAAFATRNIVLICNLDPRATAEDVGEACSLFGPILSCDILVDTMGRPLNEAEVEFLYAESARDCVAKLDKNIADGRVLHVKLQDQATLPVKPRYSSRTVIASDRAPSHQEGSTRESMYGSQRGSRQRSPIYHPQSSHRRY